jgi:uncharacterized membrane protein (DUF373 family)
MSPRSIWTGPYQGFERMVAMVLTGLIGLIILVALYRLAVSVTMGLVAGALDPTDPEVFQAVFGEVLTLMIALEFNHTLQLAGARDESIVQTRVVVLIALLALARKFIVMDFASATPAQVAALAAMAVALGVAYRLTREPPAA